MYPLQAAPHRGHPPFLLKTSLILILCCLPLLMVILAIDTCQAALIEGMVFSSQGPVAGAEVRAYPDYQALVSEKSTRISSAGEKPGQYRLELPPGRYFLIATARQEGKTLFSYHGLNPIVVTEDFRWLPFFVVEQPPPDCRPGPTGIGGLVSYKNHPLAGGTVSVYAVNDEQFRGMGILTNTIGPDGRFLFDLPPGTYVAVARQRFRDATSMGPLRKGDLFCYSDANPIQIKPETICQVEIPCYPRDDLAGFLDAENQDPRGRKEPDRRQASLQDTRLFQEMGNPATESTPSAILSGTVTDVSGQPRPGLYVQAYPTSHQPIFQMHMIRLITDRKTKSDERGRFRLELPAGTYYLVAREKLGEAPEPGEFYGLYEETANHTISLLPGVVTTEAVIRVEQVMTRE